MTDVRSSSAERIEQAIFTSVRGPARDGYQIAATSPGVSERLAAELSQWAPTHDSLAEGAADSLNFHPLSNGDFCISQTTLAGGEYSGRGERVYTQLLVVRPSTLTRFANQPFSLFDAAAAAGRVAELPEMPRELAAFLLAGRLSPVNFTRLSRLLASVGRDRLAQLLDTLLTVPLLAVATPLPPRRLLAGLLDLLPPVDRPRFSLTTGLRFSERRPFRLMACRVESLPRPRGLEQNGYSIFDLTAPASSAHELQHEWSRHVHAALQADGLLGLRRLFRDYVRPTLTAHTANPNCPPVLPTGLSVAAAG